MLSVAIGLCPRRDRQAHDDRRQRGGAPPIAGRNDFDHQSIEEPSRRSHHAAPLARLSKYSSRTSEEIKQVSTNAINMTMFVQQMVSVAIVIAGTYEFSEGRIAMGAIVATCDAGQPRRRAARQIAMTLARFRQATMSLRILDKIVDSPTIALDGRLRQSREVLKR